MGSEAAYRCTGCAYDDRDYTPMCYGCRRMNNIYFNTPEESSEYIVLLDKYTELKVVYGVTKILKRSSSM